MKTYGTLKLRTVETQKQWNEARATWVRQRGKWWHVEGRPHMLMMLKRVFVGLSHAHRHLRIDDTPANAETLAWFMERYPLEMRPRDRRYLESVLAATRDRRARAEEVLLNAASLPPVPTRIPLRDYQQLGVRLLECSNYLCGDDLGLGKTAIAIGAVAAGMSPAIFVCQTHLQDQWRRETERFLGGGVKVHIVKSAKPYELPEHHVLIVPYSKLSGWADWLEGYKLVVFDECQELRRAFGEQGRRTAKYAAAEAIAARCEHRLGLSATPVYNYGDEIFNILEILEPGMLGTRGEFQKEWCHYNGRHHVVADPSALGAFLAENRLFLRRRRREVGRELPPVQTITQDVEYNETELLRNEDHIFQLASLVLHGKWEEKGRASLELDAMMRLQTGLAKAPFVVEFVKELAGTGSKVLLAGWHREVYDVWERLFESAGIKVAFYTGSETAKQKEKSRESFVEGDAQVMIISLRSGAGLDGLQSVCDIVVFGELDWSPQVHGQLVGRLNRDGLMGPVTAVYLVAAGGADPIIAHVCGVKKAQNDGIINPGGEDKAVFDHQATEARGALLARRILGNFEALKRKEAA